ncbi:hypothetical protein [Pedobacter sp. V48]|uniref:hypothetical protein n=1 Tax=Pedobacter sp. V48 TaxID=509635 RepID=UPI0003E4D754|nr:hypothetical protein [Pedobacter sp. V48]ETZ23126.1 hypothetical protein N824_16840 [Pedobacter sp. V48]
MVVLWIEISIKHVLNALQVLSWIILIGLCIEAGTIIFNLAYTLAVKPIHTDNFWQGADLSDLYQHDHGHFMVIALFKIIVAVMKAIIFYLIIKLFADKKLSIAQPFTSKLRTVILNVAFLTLGISFFSHYGSNYVAWLSEQKIEIADPNKLDLYAAEVWFFGYHPVCNRQGCKKRY